jgi:Fe-S-cluster containining protein
MTERPGWETRGDRRLLRVVDDALSAGARRAGDRLACRVGCTECCVGPFPISQLDARRLREGLEQLREREPKRASAIVRRAAAAVRALRRGFPGDAGTGRLAEGEPARQRFFARHKARPCPVLDPLTGACELYEARPLTCRGYGPPLRVAGETLPPCRLCFVGASARTIESCRVTVDPEGLEDRLLQRLQREGEPAIPETLVAFALTDVPQRSRRRHSASVRRAPVSVGRRGNRPSRAT